MRLPAWFRRPRRCSCGDGREAHRHYRPGTECSLCPCPRFTRRRRRDDPDPEFAARIRGALRAAAGQIEPDPGGLDAILARTRGQVGRP